MADKKDAKPADKPAEGAAPAKKGLPIKTIGVVAAVMLVEAAAVFMVVKAITPKAGHAQTDQAALQNDTGEVLVELKVADEKYQNMSQGKEEAWMWQINVSVQVKTRHKEKVEGLLKSREGEIREGLRQIVGRATHDMLKEADSKALNRQFTSYLNQIIPVDEKTNEPLIERVLIPRCFGFPSGL